MSKAFIPIVVGSYRSCLLLLLLGLLSLPAKGQELRLDPAKVKGPESCADCHEYNVSAWKETHHFSTFKEMARTPEAKEIAEKMGLKRIKADSDCLSCHFTSALAEDGSPDPIAGISCESCHGAGAEYIDIHSDFGGKDETAETETPEHRATRWKEAEAVGMIRPTNIYAVAQNCFSCHTVPNEKLVNVGGHTAGSNFELIRWSQGEVRHNLHYSDGKENLEAPIERRRLFYVVGKALDLEYAFRGLADATEKADYAVSMAKRAKKATLQLKEINELLSDPQLGEIIKIGEATKLKLNNKDQYLQASAKISELTQTFAKDKDGSGITAIDPLLPSADKYRGAVYTP